MKREKIREILHPYKCCKNGDTMISVVNSSLRHYLKSDRKFSCPYCSKLFHQAKLFKTDNIYLSCHQKAKNYGDYNDLLFDYRNTIKECAEAFIIKELKNPYYQKYLIIKDK